MDSPAYSALHQRFPQQERLRSKKIVQELFAKGSSVFLYPFRIQYISATPDSPPYPQVLFSVPKKHWKRAVDRNQIKRWMREAYRLNKARLIAATPAEKIPSYIAWIYIAKEKNSFEILEKRLNLSWNRLVTG